MFLLALLLACAERSPCDPDRLRCLLQDWAFIHAIEDGALPILREPVSPDGLRIAGCTREELEAYLPERGLRVQAHVALLRLVRPLPPKVEALQGRATFYGLRVWDREGKWEAAFDPGVDPALAWR